MIAGWLSLLTATLHIDLAQDAATTARLRAAATLARETGHAEIVAWCRETQAWRILTRGRYDEALELSLAAQEIAPAGSSVLIQATAQEGRARARLGQTGRSIHTVIDRVRALSDEAGMPERPSHHYRYDPTKSLTYTATTLSWAGDPAAEGVTREVIEHLAPGPDQTTWSRRAASAHVDLGLALITRGELDEAAHVTLKAITSGRIVPSNHWRAREVVEATEKRGVPEACELREAFHALTTTPGAWGSETALPPARPET